VCFAFLCFEIRCRCQDSLRYVTSPERQLDGDKDGKGDGKGFVTFDDDDGRELCPAFGMMQRIGETADMGSSDFRFVIPRRIRIALDCVIQPA